MIEFYLAVSVTPDRVPLAELSVGIIGHPGHSCFRAIFTEHPAFQVRYAVAEPSPLWIYTFLSLGADMTHGPMCRPHPIPTIDRLSDPGVTCGADQEVAFGTVTVLHTPCEPSLLFLTATARETCRTIEFIFTAGRWATERPAKNITGVSQVLQFVFKGSIGSQLHQATVHGRIGPSQRVMIIIRQSTEQGLGDFFIIGRGAENPLEERLRSAIWTPQEIR